MHLMAAEEVPETGLLTSLYLNRMEDLPYDYTQLIHPEVPALVRMGLPGPVPGIRFPGVLADAALDSAHRDPTAALTNRAGCASVCHYKS